MKALIFNSGLGNRMGNLTKNNPKCMVKLYNGETIFERQIRILSECGIKEFIITTGPFKEQLYNIAKNYHELKFNFIDNPQYKTTNYIVSMNYASKFIDDDILLLHGDLVFNKNLILKLLDNRYESVCLFNENKILPEKDFKGRFKDNILKEVSISIFDNDCYAFQPLYKLSKKDITKWKNKVASFVDNGITNVYAENALNEITNELKIYGMSYKDDYIDEIDNEEDYNRVSNEIKYFDYREQSAITTHDLLKSLKDTITLEDNLFIVCSQKLSDDILKNLKDYHFKLFTDFSSNPTYDSIKKGLLQFKEENYNVIISIGGGSAIDTAKCIKLFSSLEDEYDFLQGKYNYNNIRHIAIPTTAGTGSESTQIAVMYYKGEKISIDNGSILPDYVIFFPDALKSLSDYQKKSTLLDSLCQSIESFWSKGSTTESREYSKKSIELILENYKDYLENKKESYESMLIAANYSGKAINISRTTAAHSMSYKLTSTYGISHGHAVALCIIPIWELLLEKSKNNKDLEIKLKELANIFNVCNISESIELVSKLIKEFKLPYINIEDSEYSNLANSVNMERMKNNPIIFNYDEIYELYKKIGKKEIFMNKEEFDKVNVFGLGNPNDAFAKYFVGNSYLNPLTNPKECPVFLANVTFEPGCRNNWHIHHSKSGGGQILICTAGEGWYQEEGKEAVELKPGVVITIPANVKHWHGAKKDSWFSHIAIEVPGENTSNEWLESVTNEEYNKL